MSSNNKSSEAKKDNSSVTRTQDAVKMASAVARETVQQLSADQVKETVDHPLEVAPENFLMLQRMYGNQAVQRLIDGIVQPPPDGEGTGGGNPIHPTIERSISQARGGGQALDDKVRSHMESALASDFSGVRVHTDGRADVLNRSLDARAFTTGQDIFFREGEYSPGNTQGRELIAHELTHVVQQGGAKSNKIQPKLMLGPVGDRYEQEAEQVARSIDWSHLPAARDNRAGDAVQRASRAPSGRIRRAPHQRGGAAKGMIQRFEWSNSRVFDGKAATQGSQEQAIEVLRGGNWAGKKARVDELLAHKIQDVDIFNELAMLLSGGEGDRPPLGERDSYKTQIDTCFNAGTPRAEYLKHIVDHGKPSKELEFGLRLGKMTGWSLTFGSGSADIEDLIKYAREMTATELAKVLSDYKADLADKGLTERLTSQQAVKTEEEARANPNDPNFAVRSAKPAEKDPALMQAYQAELLEIADHRLPKAWYKSNKKKELFDDLKKWASNKTPAVIEKLTIESGAFVKRLKASLNGTDVKYALDSMKCAEVDAGYENLGGDQVAERNATIFQEFDALVDRQGEKGSFSKWRQKDKVKSAVEGMLFDKENGFKDSQTALVLRYLNSQKKSGQIDEALFKVKVKIWQGVALDPVAEEPLRGTETKATLLESAMAGFRSDLERAGLDEDQRKEIEAKFTFAAAAGTVHEQLRKLVLEKTLFWRTKRFRIGRQALDILAKLVPGSPEWQGIRHDKEMLGALKERNENAWTENRWPMIKNILKVNDDCEPADAHGATDRTDLVGPDVKGTLTRTGSAALPNDLSRAAVWNRQIRGELESILPSEDTIFRLVFGAQEDARKYEAATPNAGHNHKAFMKAVGKYINKGALESGLKSNGLRYTAMVATVGLSLIGTGFYDRGYYFVEKLLNVFEGTEELILQDLLNVARKRGGKSRTKAETVEFGIDNLPPKALLEQASNYTKIKAAWDIIEGYNPQDEATLDDLTQQQIPTLTQTIADKKSTLDRLMNASQPVPDPNAVVDPNAVPNVPIVDPQIITLQQEIPDHERDLRTLKTQKEQVEARIAKFTTSKSNLKKEFPIRINKEVFEGEEAGAGEEHIKGDNLRKQGLMSLFKREKRVEIERKLLEKIAKAAEEDAIYQKAAAYLMGFGTAPTPDQKGAATKYQAQMTRGIGHMEGAQLLASGKQWSWFSTRSLIYKEEQRRFVGEFRSAEEQLAIEQGQRQGNRSANWLQELQGKGSDIAKREQSLQSEEKAFKALRDKYNERFKFIVMLFVQAAAAVITTMATGGLAAPIWTAMWAAAVSSACTSAVGGLIDWSNRGDGFDKSGALRDAFFKALIDGIGGLLGNIGYAVKTMGSQTVYGSSNAAIGFFGGTGLGMASTITNQFIKQFASYPVAVVDKFFKSGSLDEALNKAHDDIGALLKAGLLPQNLIDRYLQGVISGTAWKGVSEISKAIGGDANATIITGSGNNPKYVTDAHGNTDQAKSTVSSAGWLNPFGSDIRDVSPFGTGTGKGQRQNLALENQVALSLFPIFSDVLLASNASNAVKTRGTDPTIADKGSGDRTNKKKVSEINAMIAEITRIIQANPLDAQAQIQAVIRGQLGT